jgi:sulfoxide reductase heme-binding subunit YedZ
MQDRRLTHLALAGVTLVACAAIPAGVPRLHSRLQELSVGLGYVSFAYLVLALGIGPYTVLRHGRRPLNVSLRRDVGIWAGLTGIAHTAVALQVHMQGRMTLYFLFPGDAPALTRLRYDLFGVANYLGAAVTLALLVLVPLSSDAALRILRAVRWKLLQRLTYPAFVLAVLHTVAYQYLTKRPSLTWALVLALTAVVVTLQVAGARRYRAGRAARRRARA